MVTPFRRGWQHGLDLAEGGVNDAGVIIQSMHEKFSRAILTLPQSDSVWPQFQLGQFSVFSIHQNLLGDLWNHC